MKKSNKLLLASFLTVLLFLTAIHVTLYAKYKSGDYTVYNEEEDPLLAMNSFPNILFVSVSNVPTATVRFSDVAQVGKEAEEDLQYVRKGDTLMISSKGGPEQEYIRRHVLHVPHNATLSLINSTISLEPGKKNVVANPVIYLKKSSAIFASAETPFQLGQVKVVATDSSAALFHGKTNVNQLEVQLSRSSIEYMEGDFGQLSIVTDSLSRIALQAKHLSKANIKTLAPQ